MCVLICIYILFFSRPFRSSLRRSCKTANLQDWLIIRHDQSVAIHAGRDQCQFLYIHREFWDRDQNRVLGESGLDVLPKRLSKAKIHSCWVFFCHSSFEAAIGSSADEWNSRPLQMTLLVRRKDAGDRCMGVEQRGWFDSLGAVSPLLKCILPKWHSCAAKEFDDCGTPNRWVFDLVGRCRMFKGNGSSLTRYASSKVKPCQE